MSDPSQDVKSPTAPRTEVEIAAKTHLGTKRENNEDHYLAVRRRRSRTVLATNLVEGELDSLDEEAYALVVADGMGGRAMGELASQLALRTGWDLGAPDLRWTAKASDESLRQIEAKARLYFEMIDEAIAAHAAEQPEQEKMGTTLTIFFSVSSRGFIFHAGDSRVYLLSGGELTLLTRDHTIAQQLADSGAIPQQSVSKSPFRNMLTNYVGSAQRALRVDVSTFELKDGDVVMVCSDGLTDVVSEAEIQKALGSATSSEQACDALIGRALENSARDNVTVLVGRYRIGS